MSGSGSPWNPLRSGSGCPQWSRKPRTVCREKPGGPRTPRLAETLWKARHHPDSVRLECRLFPQRRVALRLLRLRHQRGAGLLEEGRAVVERDLAAVDLEANPEAQGVQGLQAPVMGMLGQQLFPLCPAIRTLAVVGWLR